MDRHPDRAMSHVAVIVLNYNYGRYLGECLDSIDRQTHPDVRIILVDDASTDDSREVIAAFLTRTRLDVDVIAKPENRGPADSYNLALKRLRPDDAYVAVIDADDTFYPTKISVQAKVLERADTDIVAIYSDVDERHENLGVLERRVPRRLPHGRTPMEQLLSFSTFIPLPSALIRAEAMRSMQPLDERVRLCDYAMWVQLARKGGMAYHEHPVATIRLHGSSMSHSEKLTADKLRLLARGVRTRDERRWARIRGRRQLRTAVVQSQRLPIGVQYEYLVRTRDPLSLVYGPLTAVSSMTPVSWIRALRRWRHCRR